MSLIGNPFYNRHEESFKEIKFTVAFSKSSRAFISQYKVVSSNLSNLQVYLRRKFHRFHCGDNRSNNFYSPIKFLSATCCCYRYHFCGIFMYYVIKKNMFSKIFEKNFIFNNLFLKKFLL